MNPLEYETARAMLSIEPDDLEQEFIGAPDIVSFFVDRYADALGVYLKARMFFEQTEGRLRLVVREQLTAKAKKEYRDDCTIEDDNVAAAKLAGHPYKRREVKLHTVLTGEVDGRVMQMKDYTDARNSYIMAEVDSTRLKGWCDVSRVKKDMLTNLGMRVNAELKGAGWTPPFSRPPGEGRPAKPHPSMEPGDPPF